MRPRALDSSLSVHALLAVGTLVASCQTYTPPGFGPPLVPPAPLQPEPIHCGHVGDPVRTSPVDKPIVGAADLHNHQFANLGFGGNMLFGHSFRTEGGIEQALSVCGAEGLCLDAKEFAICSNIVCAVSSNPAGCRADCETRRCTSPLPHGHFGVTDPVGMALGQGYGHDVHGFPHFMGWPHWSTYTHQQVYHRWLRRAFDGGLKLMVMQAVTNVVLCKLLDPDHPCDDMANVDLQLKAAAELEEYIDRQNDCKVDHDGWYRIAKSPAQARQIIAEGGMAVVLGIEVDTLFNCYQKGGCTPESVRRKIEHYHGLGVRHVYPMHVFDNAFGGAAAYDDLFNFGNVIVNHRLMDVRDCASEGYEFRFGKAASSVREFIATLAEKFGVDYPEYPSAGAHCKAHGLTDLGRSTIAELMTQKMIIDVDHMSARTRAEVLAMASTARYRGIVSGHSGFAELYKGDRKSEGQLTADEVKKIVALGGMLAPILHQGDTDHVLQDPGKRIANDCGNSAKSFAQAYLYAARAVGPRGAVGLGSDLNGLAGLPSPRFGPYACGGDRKADQTGRVNYPIPIHGDLAEPMPRSQAGNRVFDVNVDGYAHAGMFPDFIAELRAIGLDAADLNPLFRSAEAYIVMWECTENPAGPNCGAHAAPH